ncbi:MAG: hypothetical protein A2499_04845 [Stygiobacter sp. RIFOXYC12_FULL_38_8]|nr:MAG: hypothetical protein A2279_04515 [Stygiobacter sp. RIFOXYA12_FULL_38_9]OGV08665.1 MAG: hypothetical protein A2299_16215 [Stygiobacter sp. RIFOXYB2_FULL_37_11]OGV13453.1 MAG: hypothetical protein A2237_16910 [Stygiobacter sp. RIFOXYA2_FULL_38_8]OGV14743.1 MAG: hypothetical protein A2440_09595 [Stygiobacter sp. RIFOXYC2_FULL_38_25]OGV22279.1 MAG: hypothetical protein A2499_04845 [Stygiobacter sp. RIFOXYC12_FULL_38_8]OGV79236.1 MAG: hypothetical protein A2X65_01965 [Stygiobacter sp. GWF2_
MLTQERKEQYRKEKKEKIIRIRKTLSEMTEKQRQAIADKFGIVTVEGHSLTAHNQCFLVAQSELNFSIVGGYKQWQKAGRSVRKGEHGFYIFVPSKTKEESENSAEVSADDETPFFFTAVVFDISQTEAIAKSEAA